MFYQIDQTLKHMEGAASLGRISFAAVLTPDEWAEQKEQLGFPVYADFDLATVRSCKAEVFAKYISGSIVAPDKSNVLGKPSKLVYFINENGIVFVDGTKLADSIIGRMVHKFQNQEMNPELFLCSFLSFFLENDIELLEKYENRLFGMEENALKGNIQNFMPHLLKIRRELTRLRYYYEQLEDMAREFEGNEKHYFHEERMHNIHLFGDRAGRLQSMTQQSIDYCQTLRDIYQVQIDRRQNKNMQLMTVVTSIFFPLTVITGWYGMNFTHMPELHAKWGYLVIILVSLGVLLGEIIWLKKKKTV